MTEQGAPGIGHNEPPLAAQISAQEEIQNAVTAWLDGQFGETQAIVSELLETARALPTSIDDEATMAEFAKLIRRFRDEAKRIEAFHAKEKAPYLRGGQAVDVFFFSLWEKCIRRSKTAKPGAADILQARLDDYTQRKLAAERERLRREAEEAERVAREAREKAERETREAEEARLAAERARKPETIEQKGAVAAVAEATAALSRADADIAHMDAIEAQVAATARPADIVRTRVEQGPTVTMASEPYAVIEDEAKLDRNALWPFISFDAKEKALRAWAKTTNHNQQMSGAKIGRRQKTVVR